MPMHPYFVNQYITLYHGDARELCNLGGAGTAVVTAPPWAEDPDATSDVLWRLEPEVMLCLWRQLDRPPSLMPLVAIHIWHRLNAPGGSIYQTVHHYRIDHRHEESDLLSCVPEKNDEHPHAQPLELMQWMIGKVESSLIIVDPFAGSGTTLLAAQQLGRRAIGVEVNEQHCALTVRRLCESTS